MTEKSSNNYQADDVFQAMFEETGISLNRQDILNPAIELELHRLHEIHLSTVSIPHDSHALKELAKEISGLDAPIDLHTRATTVERLLSIYRNQLLTILAEDPHDLNGSVNLGLFNELLLCMLRLSLLNELYERYIDANQS